MRKTYRQICLGLLAFSMFSMAAKAGNLAVGLLFWDVKAPGSTGSFDITNMTGVNSSGDSTFPVTTSLSFNALSLSVHFEDGSSATFGPSYFTANGIDGGFNGNDIAIGGANPLPDLAQLSGTVSPLSITLFDGSTDTILPDLLIGPMTPSSGSALSDGDFAVIYAQPAGAGSGVPEPASWMLVLPGAAFLFKSMRNRLSAAKRGENL
jgi:hypothetical protein